VKRAEGLKLAAVLLAAGASRRLGQPKQLVKRDGESLVRRAAGLLLNLGADPIVVVTGFRAEEVSRQLNGLALTVVENPDWALGMGGSIACGMRSVPVEVDGVLLMLCDQWLLNSIDLARLMTAWKSDISRIIASGWKQGNSDVSGPPVIFPGELIHELLFVNGERGARPVIDRHRDIVNVVKLENAASDLDEPHDMKQLD
jgi:CTP:molybdopterin cytidylyltransferase MocA